MTIPWWMKRLLTAFALCFCIASGAHAQGITVFAAASLKEALDQIVIRFEAETGHTVTTSFAGSSALARQIEYGAPADIFISASTDWMDRLADRGDIKPETRVDLVQNRLVLIGAQPDAPIQILNADTDLSGMLEGGRLAMALTEAVPAGIYGKAALQHLGLWDSVADSVAQTDNVRAALALVALKAAPLGIVYATDALAEPRVQLIGIFPATSHPAIVYPAAITTQSASPNATAFLDYLLSDTAHDILEDHGFIVTRE